MRKTLNKIGWKYTVFGITYIIIQVALELLIAGLFPVFYDKYGTYVALALVVLSVDVVGFPLLFLLTIKMPKAELGHQKFHFGNFLLRAAGNIDFVDAGKQIFGAYTCAILFAVRMFLIEYF